MSSCQEEEYLQRALIFLKEYQWIYNCKNTDILSEQVLNIFPKGWTSYFNTLSVEELHDLVLGRVKEPAPMDLRLLINEINHLNPAAALSPITLQKPLNNCGGLSAKKAHEIALLAPVIHEICQETGIDLIVDIGCGLGHLPHLLHNQYGYKILALEASSKLITTARTHQKPANSNGLVVFERLFVTEHSAPSIADLIKKHFPINHNQKVCLTGLHACADLSVDALKLFTNLEEASAMVIMPCCYHRIAVVGDGKFKSFPASAKAKELFDKCDAQSFLGQPFLRLACQQTKGHFVQMSFEEHQRHARQCLQRAVLQLVARMENCTVRRLKRKSGKSDATDSDEGFQDYLNNLPKTHELVGRTPKVHQTKITDEGFLLKMHEKWKEHRNDCWQVEALMGLQAAIQGICENVILLDRVEFLKEKGVHCYKRKITNDRVSPRCWALIAKKNLL